MERYIGRVALVTGASAGIGAAITLALLRRGLSVVGLARRAHRIRELEIEDAPGKLHALECDLRKEEDIINAFEWIKENVGTVDILVNNAGVAGETAFTVSTTEEWRNILEVNILGLSICTREAVKIMVEKGIDDGLIINISSVNGLYPPSDSYTAMYAASKHAVQMLTEGLRKDLLSRNSKIRVTSICPGLVKTEIMGNLEGFDKEMIFSQLAHIQPEDVANALVYVLSQPITVEIPLLAIQPVGQWRTSDVKN